MGRYVFKLPDVGEGTAEAELVAWHVKVGDTVAEDQIIADIMTDKATVELTSPVAGRVTAAHGEPGQQLAVGSPLVEFEVEGAGNAAGAEAPPPSNPAPQASVPLTGGQTATVSSPPRGEGDHPEPKAKDGGGAPTARTLSTRNERPLASPAVRKRARDLGIALQFVPGSGPAGRIEHGDLDAYVASGGHGSSAPGASAGSTYARAEGTTETRIIGLRRKIAEKMADSVRRIPHITYVEEIDSTSCPSSPAPSSWPCATSRRSTATTTTKPAS